MSKLIKTASIFAAALIISFFVWVGFVATHYTPPILMYHYVNEEEPLRSKLGVSPKAFERQMRFLSERGYNVVSLSKMAQLIKDKKRIPPKTVAITFDDGYLDNYINAYPVLKKYNLAAAIFVVPERVGRRLNNDDYMDWPRIIELSKSGIITIASHSMSHPNLSEIKSDEELKYEIFQSKIVLEEKLGKSVDLFSYPFGGISPKAKELVREAGYKAAVGTNFPRNHPSDDIYGLKRIRIAENAGNMFIFWVQISGRYTYIKEHRDDY